MGIDEVQCDYFLLCLVDRRRSFARLSRLRDRFLSVRDCSASDKLRQNYFRSRRVLSPTESEVVVFYASLVSLAQIFREIYSLGSKNH
jgi:hypothetical protein